MNEASITRARQGAINSVKQNLDLLENCRSFPAGSQVELAGPITDAETAIVEACDRKAAFSAAVISLVKTRKAEPWIANVLPRVDLSP